MYDTIPSTKITDILQEIDVVLDDTSNARFPSWLVNFLYNLKEFFERKLQTLPIKESVSQNFDVVYKKAEAFFSLGSYLSAKKLYSELLSSFPSHSNISLVKQRLVEISRHVEREKAAYLQKNSSSISQDITKKIDPSTIDPNTGKPYDDFA